jgi:phage/plasmid-like protein (TIGR03299 family)
MIFNESSFAWGDDATWAEKKLSPGVSTSDMMTAAGLDWAVEKRPLSLDGKPIKEAFALVRKDTSDILDIVGPAYTPVQNAEALNFFNEFVTSGKARMDFAGSLNKGQMVYAIADLGKTFTLPGKDKVMSYLLLASPHRQGKAMVAKFMSRRILCNNAILAAASASAGNKRFGVGDIVRRAHRGEFDEVAQDKAKAALGFVRDQAAKFQHDAEHLVTVKMTEEKQAQFIARVFGDDDFVDAEFAAISANAGKATRAAIAALRHAPGAMTDSSVGTAWGTLNAISYTTDHIMRKDANSRTHNAWFGKNANIKLNALELLMKV